MCCLYIYIYIFTYVQNDPLKPVEGSTALVPDQDTDCLGHGLLPTSDHLPKISQNPGTKTNKSASLGNSCLGPNITATTCLQLDRAKGRMAPSRRACAPLFAFACASLSVLSVYQGCYFRCNLFQPS